MNATARRGWWVSAAALVALATIRSPHPRLVPRRRDVTCQTRTLTAPVAQCHSLDLKMRTLVCVVSHAATGADPDLAIHLRMALRQDWTEEELMEGLCTSPATWGQVGARSFSHRAARLCRGEGGKLTKRRCPLD